MEKRQDHVDQLEYWHGMLKAKTIGKRMIGCKFTPKASTPSLICNFCIYGKTVYEGECQYCTLNPLNAGKEGEMKP